MLEPVRCALQTRCPNRRRHCRAKARELLHRRRLQYCDELRENCSTSETRGAEPSDRAATDATCTRAFRRASADVRSLRSAEHLKENRPPWAELNPLALQKVARPKHSGFSPRTPAPQKSKASQRVDPWGGPRPQDRCQRQTDDQSHYENWGRRKCARGRGSNRRPLGAQYRKRCDGAREWDARTGIRA